MSDKSIIPENDTVSDDVPAAELCLGLLKRMVDTGHTPYPHRSFVLGFSGRL
jgi:hypothetical protein